MSGFDKDWLALREPADIGARDEALLAAAIEVAENAPGHGILDIGCGTGSTFRTLSPRLRNPIHWRLFDYDQRLLDEARRLHGDAVELAQGDLNDIAGLPLEGIGLITASALFDLCSQAFIDRFVTRIAEAGIGLYAALCYDGVMRWSKPHPLDDVVTANFNAHQLTDKGFGLSLGPKAWQRLAERLAEHGYTVKNCGKPLDDDLERSRPAAAFPRRHRAGRLRIWRTRRFRTGRLGEFPAEDGDARRQPMPCRPSGRSRTPLTRPSGRHRGADCSRTRHRCRYCRYRPPAGGASESRSIGENRMPLGPEPMIIGATETCRRSTRSASTKREIVLAPPSTRTVVRPRSASASRIPCGESPPSACRGSRMTSYLPPRRATSSACITRTGAPPSCSILARSGRRPLQSTTTRTGLLPVTARTERLGLSATTVPTPTMTASTSARQRMQMGNPVAAGDILCVTGRRRDTTVQRLADLRENEPPAAKRNRPVERKAGGIRIGGDSDRTRIAVTQRKQVLPQLFSHLERLHVPPRFAAEIEERRHTRKVSPRKEPFQAVIRRESFT